MTIEFPQSQGSSSANILHNDWGNCEEPHVERLELVEVLSGADRDDRRVRRCHRRERAATLGVPIQLGDDDGSDVDRLICRPSTHVVYFHLGGGGATKRGA